MSLIYPARHFGDIGAAFGPVCVAMTLDGYAHEYREGPTLIYASSDEGARAAIIIEELKN